MEAVKRAALTRAAAEIRLRTLEATHAAASGHPGGSLSVADILAYLYFERMRIDPARPAWPDRDRLVLSKGHAAPALYAALALRGFFPPEELRTLRSLGSFLQGHPDMKGTPGVDMSTGSLGQGVSAACGMALAGKADRKGFRVYAIIGDGESEEGQVWEAMMFASARALDNLCVILDSNGLQIDGPVRDIVHPSPFAEKFEAFGCRAIRADAHDFDSLEAAFDEAERTKGRPTVIVAESVKGKGVSFMENQVEWHGKAPNDDQYRRAVAEIRARMEGEPQ